MEILPRQIAGTLLSNMQAILYLIMHQKASFVTKLLREMIVHCLASLTTSKCAIRLKR